MRDLRNRSFVDTLLEIQSTGQINGKTAKAFHIAGRRSAFTSTTAFNDIGEGIGVAASASFPQLTGSEAIEIISSSANDDGNPAGTGARTVTVTYIDSNWAIQQTTVTMNGTTAVSVLASGMLLPLTLEVANVGSLGGAAGTITLRTTTPTTLSIIAANGNRSLDAYFLVPEGYSAYIPQWSAGCIQNSQDVRLRATVDFYTRAQGTVYHFQDQIFIGANANRNKELPWLKFSQYTLIKASTISSSTAVATRCDADFWVIIIAD